MATATKERTLSVDEITKLHEQMRRDVGFANKKPVGPMNEVGYDDAARAQRELEETIPALQVLDLRAHRWSIEAILAFSSGDLSPIHPIVQMIDTPSSLDYLT